MIKYMLRCSNDHEFDVWFRNSQAFEHQASDNQIACPQCANRDIQKSLMSPSISSKEAPTGNTNKTPDMQQIFAMWKEMGRTIRKEAEHVGTEFPEEARKIHFNEAPPRQIWGQASFSEAKELLEDGVEIVPLPDLPEESN